MNFPGWQVPNMLLEVSGETSPERLKRRSQSKNKTHTITYHCISPNISILTRQWCTACRRQLYTLILIHPRRPVYSRLKPRHQHPPHSLETNPQHPQPNPNQRFVGQHIHKGDTTSLQHGQTRHPIEKELYQIELLSFNSPSCLSSTE